MTLIKLKVRTWAWDGVTAWKNVCTPQRPSSVLCFASWPAPPSFAYFIDTKIKISLSLIFYIENKIQPINLSKIEYFTLLTVDPIFILSIQKCWHSLKAKKIVVIKSREIKRPLLIFIQLLKLFLFFIKLIIHAHLQVFIQTNYFTPTTNLFFSRLMY